MPKRRKTRFEDLPEDIVVDQILVRLPSKAVGRCRVVSKSWLSATSTPGFMLEHHRRQPSLPILDGDGRPATFNICRDNARARASNKHLWSILLGYKNHLEYSIQGACDGFLIVRRIPARSKSRFYIYNPVTHKHALLPKPQVGQEFISNVIGFYRNDPTGEYRLLWVSWSSPLPRLSKSILHVLTVGSDEPRHVMVTMPAASSPSVEHKLLEMLCHSSYSEPPVHHRGNLHWYPSVANNVTGGAGEIIVFDTKVESFRWMRSPTKPGHTWKLFNMNGKLAFWHNSTPIFTTMDVWVMQDYETEIWVLKYRIDVSTLEASRQLYLASVNDKKKNKTPVDSMVLWFNDMAVLNERELLILFNKKHVLRCDIDGKFLGLVNLENSRHPRSITQHRLQESIVPFPCQEMHEGDEESPFSTWYV